MTLKLVSPAFVDLNKQGLIKREGRIYFDKEEAQIREASGDYVLLTLPVLNLPYHLRVDISLLFRNELLYRCRACMLYRPTVSGSVFAGFTEGAADGTFHLPAEMTLDAAGNLYVIDQRSGHDRILRVSPAGDVTDFAGAMDEFGRLTGIAIDNGRGLLYVADAASQQIKAVRIADPVTINVLAGSGTAGNVDGTGGAASFRFGDNAVDDSGQSEAGQGMTIDPIGKSICRRTLWNRYTVCFAIEENNTGRCGDNGYGQQDRADGAGNRSSSGRFEHRCGQQYSLCKRLLRIFPGHHPHYPGRRGIAAGRHDIV